MTLTPELKFISTLGIIISFSLFANAAAPETLSDEVPGKYIVVLRDDVSDSDQVITEIEKKHGVSAEMRYSRVIKGFSVSLSNVKLAKMKFDPRVAFISEDRVVTIDGKPEGLPAAATKAHPTLPSAASSVAEERVDSNGRPANRGGNNSTTTQPIQIVPVGISRIGAVNLANKGTGVGVAVIDTGIDLQHPDLAANVSSASKTCVKGSGSAQDDNGHGTHVAGTIAALNNTIGAVGVAPEATLYAVKVLDKNGSGTWSSIICGIDWVTANAQALNIRVANMSLGGTGTSDNNCGLSNNDALHRALCNSAASGVTYVVAAGNSASDATQSVPASYDDTVITVSAIADTDGQFGGFGIPTPYGADDTFATFSNYGTPVDLGAPGVNIFSTWKGGTYKTISGTSMASPHVAGATALYLKSNPTATLAQVRSALLYFGERLGAGHTDPSGLHPEPVVSAILP